MIEANTQGNQTLQFSNIEPSKAIEAIKAFSDALPIWEKLWQSVAAK